MLKLLLQLGIVLCLAYGVNPAGTDAIGRYSMRTELQGDRFRQCDQTSFRHVNVSAVRPREQPFRSREMNDSSPSTFTHVRHSSSRKIECRIQIDIDDPVPVVDGYFGKCLIRSDSDVRY